MSYLTQSQTNRPAAILGVIAIHAGLAALVVTGLTVAGFVRPPTPPIIGVQLPPQPPPPDPQIDKNKPPIANPVLYTDRKSVVEGKRVSVRVDSGGRRIIKK